VAFCSGETGRRNWIYSILLGRDRKRKLNVLHSSELPAFCSGQTTRRNWVYDILLALQTPATKVACR
jgi:hypothetical protein